MRAVWTQELRGRGDDTCYEDVSVHLSVRGSRIPVTHFSIHLFVCSLFAQSQTQIQALLHIRPSHLAACGRDKVRGLGAQKWHEKDKMALVGSEQRKGD